MNYLSCRQSSVLFRGQNSRAGRTKQGVPQSGVLSSLRFSYISKLPQLPHRVPITSYADDCKMLTPGIRIDCKCLKVSTYFHDLSRYFTARSLMLSSAKFTTTIFTNWTKECRVDLNIFVDDIKIPIVSNPKILGVAFVSLPFLTPHTKMVINKVQSRNKILKLLAGST